MMHIAQVVVEKTREAITSRNNYPTSFNDHQLTSLAHVFVFFTKLTCFFLFPQGSRLNYYSVYTPLYLLLAAVRIPVMLSFFPTFISFFPLFLPML